MATLSVRNISTSLTKLTYDLYFTYDANYLIQPGKALGFRVHEYGNEYIVQFYNAINGAITRTSGYGNGGASNASFITYLDPTKSQLYIGSVTWTIDPNAVVQTRSEWSSILNNFGSDEYAAVAMGFSQVISYSARDITLSSNSIVIEGSINHLPSGVPKITGAVKQGELLVASNNLTDDDGLGLVTYQWQSSTDLNSWMDLSIGSSLTLSENQVGKFIRVIANYRDGNNRLETVTSEITEPVVNLNDLPQGNVSISGDFKQGGVLTANNNVTDIDGIGSIFYQWQFSSDNNYWLNSITGSIFTLTNAEVGKYIRVIATYVDGHGSLEVVKSSPTLKIQGLAPVFSTSKHNVSLIVNKGILGPEAVLLKDVAETLKTIDGSLSERLLEYAGNIYDYKDISKFIMTITRDGEFTPEFTKEINDYVRSDLNIKYQVAVALIGLPNIDSVILSIAGSDGNYIG